MWIGAQDAVQAQADGGPSNTFQSEYPFITPLHHFFA
jgi:hypothetical protein